jgi:hypothetical protein
MLIVREAIGFSGSLFRALGQKGGKLAGLMKRAGTYRQMSVHYHTILWYSPTSTGGVDHLLRESGWRGLVHVTGSCNTELCKKFCTDGTPKCQRCLQFRRKKEKIDCGSADPTLCENFHRFGIRKQK